MAIKVIKDGPDTSVVKQVVCNHCGATLEYTPIDVQQRSYMDYGGDTATSYWINCPKCNNHIPVANPALRS